MQLVSKLFCLAIVCISVLTASAEEVVYTQQTTNKTVKVEGIQPAEAYAEFNTDSRDNRSLIANQYMTLTIHRFKGKRISHIVLSMKSDDYTGTGEIEITAGAKKLATFSRGEFNTWVAPHRSVYKDLDIDLSNNNYTIGDEDVTIRIVGTTTYICCQSFKIIYDDGAVSFKATDGVNYYATFSHNDAVALPKLLPDGRKLHAEVLTVENNFITKKDLVNDFECEDADKIIVPANTGVLLRVEGASSAPVVEFSIFSNGFREQTTADVAAANMLIPCLATGPCPTADGNCTYYKLAYDVISTKQSLGFWYGATNGSNDFNVKGNGAVLCVPKSVCSNVRGFSFDASGVVTGMNRCVDVLKHDAIYNLKGLRVGQGMNGVGIKDGRKVLLF